MSANIVSYAAPSVVSASANATPVQSYQTPVYDWTQKQLDAPYETGWYSGPNIGKNVGPGGTKPSWLGSPAADDYSVNGPFDLSRDAAIAAGYRPGIDRAGSPFQAYVNPIEAQKWYENRPLNMSWDT